MKKIHVFCFANYCRSPVVEKVLQNLLGEKYQVTSSGLKPITRGGMDTRSQKYLKSIGIENLNHFPSQIQSHHLKNNDLILAMDSTLLASLVEKKFKISNKLKIFHFLDKENEVHDPYSFSDEDYKDSMSKIHLHCEKWAKFILEN